MASLFGPVWADFGASRTRTFGFPMGLGDRAFATRSCSPLGRLVRQSGAQSAPPRWGCSCFAPVPRMRSVGADFSSLRVSTSAAPDASGPKWSPNANFRRLIFCELWSSCHRRQGRRPIGAAAPVWKPAPAGRWYSCRENTKPGVIRTQGGRAERTIAARSVGQFGAAGAAFGSPRGGSAGAA